MTSVRHLLRRLALTAALALAQAGAARAGEASGLSLGARAGYAVPVGEASAGISLESVAAGAVPVQLDVSWRFDPRWRLGAYFQYGFVAIAGDFCPAGASCTGALIRSGVLGAYTFAAEGPVPWIGLGAGSEWLAATVSWNGTRGTLHLLGFEAVELQGGVDWRLSPAFSLGPWASVGLGEYRIVSSGNGPVDLAAAVHGWLQLGVKGAFDL